MLSEQMARYYLDCARRRTASSPHPCKVPVSQQHGADSHSPSRLCSGRVPGVPFPKLTRPLVTKDGGTLPTILDARTSMLALPKHRETTAQWQRAAELLLDGADVTAFDVLADSVVVGRIFKANAARLDQGSARVTADALDALGRTEE